MKNKLFLSALALLGFGGCSDGEGGGLFNEPDMYGVPLIDYRFMGEVTDADGNPIEGIEVKVSYNEDTVTTDSKGAFSTDFTSFTDSFHRVTFTDVDGVDNGGEFSEQNIDVQWDDNAVDEQGISVFDLGTIKLEEKE